MELTQLFKDPQAAPRAPESYGLEMENAGERLLGLCYTPGGELEERHPLVLFLHGFPGTEQNRDIMQSLRRMGMVTATFHYRGSWGSGGDYALSHLPEDAAAVLDYLRQNAGAYHIDPERIYLMGHSMGGFAAMQLLAAGEKVRGVIFMAPCDVVYQYTAHHEEFFATMRPRAEETLHISRGDIFEVECRENPQWNFTEAAKKIDPALPVLFLGAKYDECVPPEENIDPAYQVMQSRGCAVDYITLDGDHCFNNKRMELTETMAKWLIGQEKS